TRQEFQNILVKHGEVRDYFNENYRKDGSRIWTQTTARAIKDDDGNILYYEGFITDVTERKRAEKALHESEERFRRALENIPDVVVIYDRDLRIQYINAATLKVTGRPISDFIGRREEEIWPPEVYEAYLPTLREAFETRTIRSVETDLLIPQEGLRSLSITCVPVINEEGEVHEVLGITRNFTEHKRAEAEIRRRSDELSALNKLGSRVNQNLTLNAVVSEAVKEMIAVTQTDIAYLFLRDGDKLVLAGMGPPSGAEKFAEIPLHRVGECMCGLAVTQGKPLYSRDIFTDMRCTWEECKKAGYHSFAALPLRSGTEIIGVAGLACVAERDFESQAEFLETLASQVSSGIHNAQLYEEASHHLNQLTALNKTALQLQKLQSPQILATEIIKSLEMILNYTYGAVLLIDESGERLIPFALSAQKQDASFEEQDKRYVESHDIHVGKGITGWVAQSGQGIRLGDVRQDARYLGIRDDIRSELCVPLKAGKQVIGVINIESTQTDAYSESDERVLETIAAQVSVAIQNTQLFEQVQGQTAELERRVFERTAQLQSANKELESFSYSVSHDLRAPLRAISGFSEIIARRHRTSLNEEGQHYFDNIIQASERMGHLIDDLLTYSRLGRAGLQMEPVSLADVLTNIAQDLKGHLDELHGTISIAEDLPDVTGDKTLLGQIFTNLLENAVKYRKADVPLQIIIDWQNDNEDVILRISDNGIGIPAEYQDKIFNIFQRLHSEEEYPGTGIGLATVKKSVKLLKGNVWVESKVGEGSMFSVRLPKS
ncbi:MAG: GAF domain-containing protein, partial [Anaerolineales bacterium]|nr:GAF domain-containing protein [Anaerolineales bacterium]